MERTRVCTLDKLQQLKLCHQHPEDQPVCQDQQDQQDHMDLQEPQDLRDQQDHKDLLD